MKSVPFPRVVIATSLLFVLAACEEGPFVSQDPPQTTEDGSVVIQEARTVIQEVERGDIFSTTELALWDGRPSLGGVWVAHPDVGDPERVRITNTVNGEVISGALFRRERNNPGPRIQLSSDAAAALNILAGQPTELEVIVLRQEEIVIEPAVIAAPEPDVVEDDVEADAEEPATEATSDTVPEDAVVATAAVAATAAAAETATEEPRQGFWERFRNSLRNDPAPSDTAGSDPLFGSDASQAEVAETAAVPAVETAPLDTVAVAAAAIAAAESEEASAETPPPAPSRTSGSALQNPFIQIGLFGEQANASAAASSLRQAGIVPTVSEGANANGPFWRILVGPVNSAEDQAELLAQVKSLGYSDAFLTSN